MSAQDEAGASSAEEKPAYTYAPYTGGSAIVSAYWVERYERDAARYWDLFYRRNADHFFKDRHYLPAEWSELRPCGATPSGPEGNESATGDDDADGTDGVVSESRAALLAGKAGCAESQPRVLLEAGCGVGNTLFPLMRLDSTLCVYALDFSSTAVNLVRAHPLAASGRLTAAVGDLTTGVLPPELRECRADVATLIFVLSAISPPKMADAIRAIRSGLRDGGLVLLRDYAIGDGAQIRLQRASAPKQLAADSAYFVRQDGTRSYYFTTDELEAMFTACGFETVRSGYREGRTVNHRKQVSLERRFVTATFRKVPPACGAGDG